MRLAEGSRVIDIEKTERVTDPENQTSEDSDTIPGAEVSEEAREAGETPENEEL